MVAIPPVPRPLSRRERAQTYVRIGSMLPIVNSKSNSRELGAPGSGSESQSREEHHKPLIKAGSAVGDVGRKGKAMLLWRGAMEKKKRK